jgi:hypothetical protein
MIHIEKWPPPDWPEVVIKWEYIMKHKSHDPNTIYNWLIDQPGGYFHLHGYKSTEGFAYRFQRPEDATMFALRWA